MAAILVDDRALAAADPVAYLDRLRGIPPLTPCLDAVVLAATPALVKAYPHSLLDGLAAGRPVLVSRAIPMSRFVEQSGCGEVVEDAPAGSAEPISTHALLAAIDRLRSAYAARQAAAVRHRADFGLDQMRADFANVYAAAVATGSRRQTP